MLRWLPGKELGRAAPVMTHAKETLDTIFTFCKSEILWGFLSASENRYYCRSFIKAKWRKATFKKQGIPVFFYLQSESEQNIKLMK